MPLLELTGATGNKLLLAPAAIVRVQPFHYQTIMDEEYKSCRSCVDFVIGSSCITEYVQETVSQIKEMLL